MKHRNTKYCYAEGGFGAITIDLVRNVIVKESRKLADTSLKNELRAYQILAKQNTKSDHILKLINHSEQRLELERADCDLAYFAKTLRGFKSYVALDFDFVFTLVLLQVLEGLAFVHDAGLVHCDIKPSNILILFDLDANFIVKLCDFGLAHLITDARPVVKGTSGYTDPRAILNKTALNHTSDLWSLGITMLTIATDYKHHIDLGTKSLKARSATDADAFVSRIVNELASDRSSALGFAIYKLLTATAESSCKSVLRDVLTNI